MPDSSELPEISLEVESTIIQATNRKLKATWTYEAAQDMRANYTDKAATDLAALMAAELQAEIDKEIIEDLRRLAAEAAEKEQEILRKKKYRRIDDDWETSYDEC